MISTSIKTSPSKNISGILAILSVVFVILFPYTSTAASKPPIHTLSISFNIEKSTLSGISAVEFPANTAGSYHLDGLAVNGIWINDHQVDLDNQAQDYFSDPLHGLTIGPAPTKKLVTISYTLDLSERSSPLSDMISSDGISLTSIWHPFLHRETLFNLSAEIPSDFEAISEAEMITTQMTEKGKKQTFHFQHPLSRLNFVAGRYLVEKTQFGDGQELYTYFFEEDKDLAASYRDKTLGYLERYREMIGPFPYQRFTVIENRLPTGYAMPTFTLLGQQVVRLPFITDTSLGHETLHQWFGNSVSTAPEEGNWAEGLATYLADMLYKKEEGTGADYRKNQLVRYQSHVHQNNTMTLNQFSGGQSHLVRGQEAKRAIGYTKAAMTFQMLEDHIGSEKFYEGLRNFFNRMRHQQAGWIDLQTSFEEVTGNKLDEFFSQWLNRPDVPTITVNSLQQTNNDGQILLTFSIRQIGNSEPYKMDLPIKIITDGGIVEKIVSATEKDTKVEIPLSSQPRELVIDEEYRLMRRLALSETPPVWAGFIGAQNRVIVTDPALTSVFEPLTSMLTEMGCKAISVDEATDKELAKSSVIFLGSGSKAAKGIFATINHPTNGVTFEARNNPLNPAETAVLVSAEEPYQVIQAARKLKHYSKYSYLHFEDGRAIDKRITPSANGQGFIITQPPGGIEISKNLSFDDIIDNLAAKRVVYIGETHTRVEDHHLQLRIIQAMYRQNSQLTIGMEMFTRPAQAILDSYTLDHSINEEEFLRQSNYFTKWTYDYRFYQPILNFARHNRLPILALNIEKNIVSKVYRETGISGLDEEFANLIPKERDLSLPGYRKRISQVFGMHSGHQQKPEQLNNFLQAQSLWDETMAESISTYLEDNPERRMAVVAGRGHVDKRNAIPPRVERRLAVDQAVIVNVEQREVDAETADFLVFSPPAQLPKSALMGVLLKQTDTGVIIDKISPHGNAGKSGVKAKDLLLKLDDQVIASIEDVKIYMFYKKHGDSVKAKVKRIRKFWPDSELEINIPL